MKTSAECYPCFLTQAAKLIRKAHPDNPDIALEAVRDWAARLAALPADMSPPAMAGALYPRLCELIGDPDPFAQYKHTSNQAALDALPELRQTIAEATDPLSAALTISIAGNWLDPCAPNHMDFAEAITDSQLPCPNTARELAQRFTPGANVLILGDNAGEIVLDTLLVQVLTDMGCNTTYTVRDTPILNDATMEDARIAGMTDLCKVVSSGVSTPGTVLEQCTPDFLRRFAEADVVLSKGQGNFEALSGNAPGVYCAFKAKCPIVAQQVGLAEGASVLTRI